MKLHEYLIKKRISLQEFSEISEVDLSTIRRTYYCVGSRLSLLSANKIVENSHGYITFDDLVATCEIAAGNAPKVEIESRQIRRTRKAKKCTR